MAQRFNGTAANYLSRTASMLSINAAFTWMAWIKITTDTNTNALIYSAGNNAGTQNDTILLGADGTTLTLSVNAATAAGTNLTVGTWYHVALVRASSTDVKIYLNGVQDSASTTSVGTSRTMENMLIGSFLGAATPFNGAMDAAKAWSRALSVAEIQNEMRRHLPFSTTSLYAWWPMVHSTAALSAKDYGGSAADWTVNGTITVEQGAGIPWGGSVFVVQSSLTAAFTYTPSGGLSFSGAAAISQTAAYVGAASGGLSFAGAATVSQTALYSMTMAGGITFSGVATVQLDISFTFTPTGGLVFSGAATVASTAAYAVTGSGGITLAGAAAATQTSAYAASGAGGLSFGGAATASVDAGFVVTGAGGLQFGGAAAISASALYTFTAGGGIVFSGSGGSVLTVPGSGSDTWYQFLHRRRRI